MYLNLHSPFGDCVKPSSRAGYTAAGAAPTTASNTVKAPHAIAHNAFLRTRGKDWLRQLVDASDFAAWSVEIENQHAIRRVVKRNLQVTRRMS